MKFGPGVVHALTTIWISPSQEATKGRRNRMMPGISELLEDIKALEDYARACRSRGELRMVLVTAEEVDVIDSFRRFKAQEY
jgi:hypothetical protein